MSIIVLTVLLTSVSAGCRPRVAVISEYANQSFDPRGLITINDQRIKEKVREILADENDVRSDFRRIQDWVAKNIVYKLEPGREWQLPSDTLMKGSGDCKDYSTLLCTLWRVSGVPASDVYVAIGQSKANKRHAFLIEKYMTGKWQVVEPQVGGFIISELTAIETSEKYAITFLFNDIEYINDAYSIYRKIKGGVIVSDVKKDIAKTPPKINLFSVDRFSVTAGEQVKLQWDVSDAKYVGIDQGIGAVSLSGACMVTPTETTEYRIVALNDAGSVMENITVKVIQVSFPVNKPPLEQQVSGEQKTFIVGFDGWYCGSELATRVNAGQLTTARITLKDGNPGQYLMRIWREVSDGRSEILTQWSFIYDGDSTSQEMMFAPGYALGEANTRGYWLDLFYDSRQVWIMPESYPPRLTVLPKATVGPLKVTFIGWFYTSKSVSNIRKGQEIATGITMSGGESGRYILYAKRDMEGLNDETVAEVAFDYDGSSALQEIKFTPAYAIREASTRGYYLELYKGNNSYVWSLGGGYPPRLTVMP